MLVFINYLIFIYCLFSHTVSSSQCTGNSQLHAFTLEFYSEKNQSEMLCEYGLH